ncbi:MAG: squalene synthase HpnC [Melioribacteraceae bacterium]|nr:squalene synthase HpnC [Melioribacteraceae bacterium]
MDSQFEIESAYSDAIKFTKNHYENFPVLSFLVPKHLQKHVAIVYQFARQADDIADEGEFTDEERLTLLNEYELQLQQVEYGTHKNRFWNALHNSISEKNLDIQNFSNLLLAFKQDITKHRYLNFDELLNYCKNSANPVGRIILELNGINNEEAKQYSDKICSALQLTNFLQDAGIDYAKGRIYLPLDELDEFGVQENLFLLKENNSNFKKLMKYQVERVQTFFDEGEKLLQFLPFRLRQQIKWTVNGGRGILKKIVTLEYDVLNQRPKFSKMDLIKILF